MPPVVKLKATVIPKSLVRATILGDIMANFGIPQNVIDIAQQGFAEGLINGVTIRGTGWDGYIKDEATVRFEDLKQDLDLEVDVSDGKSMIEAISLKFAHAVSYSINTMKRKGLSISYIYRFPPAINNNPDRFSQALTRLGLVQVSGRGPRHEPGTRMRTLFTLRPGMDKGIAYSHATSARET